MTVDREALIAAAKAVRGRAYAPFSNYLVGAAVLDETGAVHAGCNVENAAYPEGICAETNAIGSMVAAGGKRIAAMAVVGGSDVSEITACTPCGGCRQRIREFADADTVIYLTDEKGAARSHRISDLLPHAFCLE